MATAPPNLVRLVDAQALARDRITARVTNLVRREVGRFDGWYSPTRVAELAEQVSLAVIAGQGETARVTDAYLARVLGQMTNRSVAPIGARVSYDELRNGTGAVEAYSRLGGDYRYRIAEGREPEKALSAVVERAVAMAQTDMTLAMRGAANQVYEARQIDGYRRVIRPELSRTGTCGLCAAASDRVYTRGNLLPIHGRCRCETLPIVDGVDPGRFLNQDELSMLYSEGGSTYGKDLKRVRVRYNEHGELGPVLTDRSHRVRLPDDLPDNVRPLVPKTDDPVDELAPLQAANEDDEPEIELPSSPHLVDNLPKKADPPNWERDIWSDTEATNPNYRQGKEYQINCTNCVSAYELRRRGYDVTAAPRPELRGRSMFEFKKLWKIDSVEFLSSHGTITQMRKKMLAEWPEGGRGAITVEWKGRGAGAHIFSVEKRNGKLIFTDPQTGQVGEEPENYFRNARPKVFALRLDDKEINDDLKEFLAL